MISELEIGRLEKGGAPPYFAKASQGRPLPEIHDQVEGKPFGAAPTFAEATEGKQDRLAGGLNAGFRVNLRAFFLFGEY